MTARNAFRETLNMIRDHDLDKLDAVESFWAMMDDMTHDGNTLNYCAPDDVSELKIEDDDTRNMVEALYICDDVDSDMQLLKSLADLFDNMITDKVDDIYVSSRDILDDPSSFEVTLYFTDDSEMTSKVGIDA